MATANNLLPVQGSTMQPSQLKSPGNIKRDTRNLIRRFTLKNANFDLLHQMLEDALTEQGTVASASNPTDNAQNFGATTTDLGTTAGAAIIPTWLVVSALLDQTAAIEAQTETLKLILQRLSFR